MMNSQWDFVDPVPWSEASTKQGIVFIRDLDGPVSVTNDAEEVLTYIQKNWPGRRVVYQGTDGEWFEIVKTTSWMGEGIGFRPWYGEVWDKLSRIES